MRRYWSILAGFLICTQAFLACNDTASSPAAIEIGEPAKVDTASQNAVTEDCCELRFILEEDGITSSNLYLNYPADSFLTKFEVGDIVTVAIVGYDTLEMPVVEYTNDVPIAWHLLSAIKGSENLTLATYYGSIAEILGISEITDPIDVIVNIKEKGGYLLGIDIMRNAQYMGTNLENYPSLSIEDFANFRAVRTTGIGENKLYRSSSPIYLYLGRNYYADSLAKEAGVSTFINLTDSEDNAESYSDFESTYYSTQNTVFLNLPVEFFSPSFKEGLARGFRYMIQHESPYLVHCTYGMDRTGFTIAVLEALMGATPNEIQEDYSKSFSNYYNVVKDKQVTLNEQQVEFFKDVVLKNLQSVYHAEGVNVPNTTDADWATATEMYLEKIGMTQEEVYALKDRLK